MDPNAFLSKAFYAPVYGDEVLIGHNKIHYGDATSRNLTLEPFVNQTSTFIRKEWFVGSGTFEVLELGSIGITVTINGNTYDDVKTARYYFQGPSSPDWWRDSVYTLTMYAPDVGIIRIEYADFTLGKFNSIDLVDYHIAK